MDVFDPSIRRLLQAVLAISGPAALFAPWPAGAMPDTFQARVEALASMETLNAEILGSHSATRALEHWCAVHAMARDAKVTADVVRDVQKPADAARRARLAVGPEEPVKYRRVRLTCGSHVLSEADNWYVPGRLTAEMNRQLETTDTPFGKAVADLKPTRETYSVTVLWLPLPDDWAIRPRPADRPDVHLEVPPVLFEHHAVLYDTQHRPFSEVDEHYTSEILAFPRGP